MVEVPTIEPLQLPHIFNPAAPLPTARVFVQESFTHEKHRTLLHYGGQFYSWDEVCYREVEDGTIRALLYEFLVYLVETLFCIVPCVVGVAATPRPEEVHEARTDQAPRLERHRRKHADAAERAAAQHQRQLRPHGLAAV